MNFWSDIVALILSSFLFAFWSTVAWERMHLRLRSSLYQITLPHIVIPATLALYALMVLVLRLVKLYKAGMI